MIIDFTTAKTERENKKRETPVRATWLVSSSLPETNAVAHVVPIVTGGYVNEAEGKQMHAAEPLKKIEDIQKVTTYLMSHGRYRDNLLFIAGINFGFRMGDLLQLRVGHFIDQYGNFKDKVELDEQKTGKHRVVWINDAVREAARLYFDQLVEAEGVLNMNQLLFGGEGNRSKNSGKPLQVKSVERILKDVVNNECGIDVHASTHMLRKTFAYHMIMGAKDRTRAIEMLQKLLNHSSPMITLRYAGITDDEIRDAYQNLNLGKIYRVSKIESIG